MAKLNKAAVELLQRIVTATAANTFVYASPKEAAALLKGQLVEQNSAMADPQNPANLATRATATGMAYQFPANAAAAGAAAPVAGSQPTQAAPKQTFNIVNGAAPAIAKRGGGGGNVYPFDKLNAPVNNVWQSFFVPSTADRPNPAKSMASTVSSATRRYKDDAGNSTRKFIARPIEDGKDWGYPGVKGAAIYRTQ